MRMTSEVGVDMISTEEASGGGNIREVVPLKKGPWTKEEDEILIDYLAKYGKGNWNDIHRVTGLARCGKSCRLRWSNHLRPDLKKGPFTSEEKALIIELHAKIGNKWSQMAAELPGRTDNEIKNFWNTRMKRRRRASLLMNHPNACIQGLREFIRNKEPGTSSVVNPYPDDDLDLLPSYNFEIPSPVFNNFEPNQLYPPELLNVVASSFPDIPGTSLLDSSLGSSSLDPPFSGEILPSSSETMIGRDVHQDRGYFGPTDTLDDLPNNQLFSGTDWFSAPDFWSNNSLWQEP